MAIQDFPGGTIVKNPIANARDMGLIPDPERFHMPQSNLACAPQPLSPCSRARERQLLGPSAATAEARAPRACALQREATTMRSPDTQLEKARVQQ